MKRWEVCVKCDDGTLAVICRTLIKPHEAKLLVQLSMLRIHPGDLMIRKISKW